MKFEKSLELQKRFNEVIPGGCHTYAKGDDQYPEFMPPYIVKGEGSRVWDADGNEFIEYGMGLRAVTLGHAYDPVIKAAQRQMMLGLNFVRPATIELECAEQVLRLIRNGEMVKFGKNGSDATNGAIRLARAYTGRDMVAICADHPFFSVEDWFMGTTPMSAGIPKTISDLTVKFRYNDINSIQEMFEKNPNRVACLIMEAEKNDPPENGFLNKAKKVCHDNGALFILDEMITGFRWHLGGAQTYYDVDPDLSCFGKAMGNGFSIAALIGKREFMKLGGHQHDKEKVFLISTTHGAETASLAASMKTMEIYEKENVTEFLHKQGDKLRAGINEVIEELKLEGYFEVIGRSCCMVYATRDQDMKPSQPFRTLFFQETMKRGLLMPSLIVSYSHSDEDIKKTIEATAESLYVYKKALEEGVEKYLVGRSVKPAIRKYN